MNLAAVTAGPRLRLAALNLPFKLLLVLSADTDADEEARVLAHWRAQVDNPPFHDRVEVFSSRTAAKLLAPWYAPLLSSGPSGLVNAALLRAVERGAKVVYDWALLRSGDGLELELETSWPVILPDVLPGAMPTTAKLPADADGITRGLVDAAAPVSTGAEGVRPAVLHHCMSDGAESTHACTGLAAVTAAAPGTFLTPDRLTAPAAHVRMLETDALLTLWLPQLQLAAGSTSVDSAWLSLAMRDIWAQRMAADLGQVTVLLPRVGSVHLRGGGGGEAPLSTGAIELADAAAAAATSWVSLAADDDPIPRSTDDGNATRRAAHLLAIMCARMAAAHAPSRLAPHACVRLVDDLAHWLRGLASAHYENGARPNCSRDDGGFAMASAARVWACQAATAAARSAWWARYPLVRSCAGRSAVPYYRRWRWSAAGASGGASGWTLAWAGAATPVPGSDLVASADPPPLPPLYPTEEEQAALRRAEAAARARGELPPPMVPDDVMIFIYTYEGRAQLHYDSRRTWAAYAKHIVTFSDYENARINAAVTRATRPEWEAASGHGNNAACAPYVLQHIYELGRARGIKYFINFDDDAIPLWPALLRYLQSYQAAHGGYYPYSATCFGAGMTTARRLLYEWEASGSEKHKARLAFDGSMGAPCGMVYGFNMSALHDYMGIVETAPIGFAGDVMQGVIMASAGRGLEDDGGMGLHPELRGSVADFTEVIDWAPAAWTNGTPALHNFYGHRADRTLPDAPGLQMLSTWHKAKQPQHQRLFVDAYYATYFGAPPMADMSDKDPHDEPCSYAPQGEHLFTWAS